MFERLKQSVVESYAGAIALGWLLAQSLVHFTNMFTAPVAGLSCDANIADSENIQLSGQTSRSKMHCPS
jgi:hypothetical protein